ncbi:hypothetical protein CPB86DRAFT_196549 [Serendipita vermifera]|nr:hypothetical protein CPB86DRAFT_196549 [Serendipita vermifera]
MDHKIKPTFIMKDNAIDLMLVTIFAYLCIDLVFYFHSHANCYAPLHLFPVPPYSDISNTSTPLTM